MSLRTELSEMTILWPVSLCAIPHEIRMCSLPPQAWVTFMAGLQLMFAQALSVSNKLLNISYLLQPAVAASANTGHNFAKKLTNRGKTCLLLKHLWVWSSLLLMGDLRQHRFPVNVWRQQAGAFGSHVYLIIQTMPSISSSLTNTNTSTVSNGFQVNLDLVVSNTRKMSLQCNLRHNEQLSFCACICV